MDSMVVDTAATDCSSVVAPTVALWYVMGTAPVSPAVVAAVARCLTAATVSMLETVRGPIHTTSSGALASKTTSVQMLSWLLHATFTTNVTPRLGSNGGPWGVTFSTVT